MSVYAIADQNKTTINSPCFIASKFAILYSLLSGLEILRVNLGCLFYQHNNTYHKSYTVSRKYNKSSARTSKVHIGLWLQLYHVLFKHSMFQFLLYTNLEQGPAYSICQRFRKQEHEAYLRSKE